MINFAGLGEATGVGDASGVGESAGIGAVLGVVVTAGMDGLASGDAPCWLICCVQAVRTRTTPATKAAGTALFLTRRKHTLLPCRLYG